MKVKITIPTNQSEIPLYAFQDYSKLETPTEIDAVSIFCNIKEDIVRKMPQSKILEINSHLSQVLQSEEKFNPTFKLEDVEFGFIPDFDAITAGELADLERYFKIGEDEGGKPVIMNIEETNKAMAVLFRPIIKRMGDKYEIQEYEGTKRYAEVMKFMPLSNLRASVVFFDFEKRIATLYPELYEGGGVNNQRAADFGKKWGWYQNFHTVAGGSYFNIERASRENIHKVLNFLAFERDRLKLKDK